MILSGAYAVLLAAHSAAAEAPPGFELSHPQTYRLRVAIRVDASPGPVQSVIATCPVPIDWPEQSVKLIAQTGPPGARIRVSTVEGQAGMLTASIPALPAGGSAVVERVYEVTRYRLRCTLDPQELRVPAKPPPDLRAHLIAAPGVEVTDRRVVQLAESLARPKARPWETVRGYFDWVRQNISFQTGAFRGAAGALETRAGDCEDLTALFVALCRSQGIPARTVWIEGHAYGEFHLEDGQGRGYWIPAQLSGPEWFGEMGEYGPILQKGDRMYDALRRRYVRYVPESARAFGGTVRLSSVREMLGDAQPPHN